MSLRQRLARLAALVRVRRLDEELDGEIQAHLELAERDALARGLSPEDARREARLSFGGIDQVREAHRDDRSARWIETFIKDSRYGLASLTRHRGFAIVSIGVLAFGIGAATALFSLMDSILFRPMPYPEPDRIVRIWEAPTPTTVNQTTNGFFHEWRARSGSFDAMSASRPARFNVAIGGEPVRLAGVLATADYFKVFGVRAAIGRTFAPDDDRPGSDRVVVLSHAAWQTTFGADPNILTRDLIFDNRSYRVIGVLPAGSFDREPTRGGPGELADFWIPLAFSPDDLTRGEHQNDVIARLRAGVSLAQAQQDMLAVRAGLVDEAPAFKKDWSVLVEPFDLRLVSEGLRQTLFLSFGAVVVVLLITCANVANLLLAKGVTRQKEMAVRTALGASRGRLVTQLLTESLVLCCLGGLGGVIVARLLLLAAAPMPSDLPSYVALSLDPRALSFASATALGAALIVGLFPALRSSVVTLTPAMSASTRGTSASHERVRRTIVVAEVAASTVLICGALLLGRSLMNLQHVGVGARVDQIVTMSVDLPLSSYPAPERAVQFMDDASARLRAVPGVAFASIASDLPLGGSGGEALTIAGRSDRILVRFKRVDTEYFSALNIPVIAGRAIGRGDRAGSTRVVVINDTLARRLTTTTGMANPIGRTVKLPALTYEERLGSPREDFVIVGVVASERIRRDLRLPIGAEEAVYVSLAQLPKPSLKLMVRTDVDRAAIWPRIREAMRQVDPRLPLGDVKTMAEVKAESLSGVATPAWAIGAFAAVALLLAALGLYGVLSHAVTLQRREIGIRMALGAGVGDVLAHIAGRASVMILLGLGLGLAGAFALTGLTRNLLFGVSPLDPASFATAGATMLTVGLVAASVPAIRAARVDPTSTLRAED
ncbi:MAG TPA: ABC transporter permease [Vicinamibacterales bacterium]|nr:ABC transporter permease [Vicinamibacterales bacterium]